MKVDIDLYATILREKCSNPKVVDEMLVIIQDYLHCSHCNTVHHKDLFPRSKTFENRGGYYPVCKVGLKEQRKR